MQSTLFYAFFVGPTVLALEVKNGDEAKIVRAPQRESCKGEKAETNLDMAKNRKNAIFLMQVINAA